MMRRHLPALVVLPLLALAAAVPAVPAAAAPALDHPTIQEVLAMTGAGVPADVIVARLERIAEVPALDGHQIAALAERGVEPAVLLRLVERAGEPAREPESRGREDAKPAPRPAPSPATLRVHLAGPFPITWARVMVDGDEVATLGGLATGESERGGILRRLERFALEPPRLLWEGEVAPGAHEVRLAYAITEVEEDPDDPWSEYSRQSYASAGVHVAPQPPVAGRWTTGDAATCTVAAGEVCEVVARADREAPTAFGGPPVYSVAYEVETGTR